MHNKNLPNISNCIVAVIGLGYVGLPLSLAIAKNKNCLRSDKKLNRRVIGYDLNSQRIRELKEGFDKNIVFKKKELIDLKFIEYTNDLEDLKNVDIFIVTVPTPIDKKKEPDLSLIKKASFEIGKIINSDNTKKDNQIIIFESTFYPGITEEICIPIIEKTSKKKFNSSVLKNTFYCGYSPERINPGDQNNTIDNIVKVTSGSNPEVAIWIDNFYGSFIKAGTHKVKSIKVAEAAKIIENTQRDINIALVNELAIFFKKLGIDTNEVLDAAATKWNFHKYRPGLVGGHCIGVDPYYLTYKANQIGFKASLISSGRKINDFMHEYLFLEIISQISKRKIEYEVEKVLIFGVTYKENCSDLRNSQMLFLIENLKKENMEITIVDPNVNKDLLYSEIGIKANNEIPENKKYTLIIFALNNKNFYSISEKVFAEISTPGTIIFDLVNRFFGDNIFHL